MKVGTFVGGRFVFSAAPAEAGDSPLCRTPWDTAKVYHILSGAKACFGMRGCACGRGTDAVLVRCGRAVCGSFREPHPARGRAVSCFRVCLLRCAARVAVSPACPAFFFRSVALSADADRRRGGDIRILPHGASISSFCSVYVHTEGACSLLVHLHLNRERSLPLPEQPSSWRIFSVCSASISPQHRSSVLPVDFLDWTKNLRQSDHGLKYATSPQVPR